MTFKETYQKFLETFGLGKTMVLSTFFHDQVTSRMMRIEGRCKEIGHPTIHTEFCEAYQTCFKGSYEAYTALEDERLFFV